MYVKDERHELSEETCYERKHISKYIIAKDQTQTRKQIDFIKIIVIEYLSFKDWSISIKWFCLRFLPGEGKHVAFGVAYSWVVV